MPAPDLGFLSQSLPTWDTSEADRVISELEARDVKTEDTEILLADAHFKRYQISRDGDTSGLKFLRPDGLKHLEKLHRLGDRGDAERAEEFFRSSLSFFPHNALDVTGLAAVLHIKFERTCSLSLPSDALELLEDCISRIPTNDEALPSLLRSCAVALLDRSEASCCPGDVEVAIEILRAGIALPSISKKESWSCQIQLSECLRRQFLISGKDTDLSEAYTSLQKCPFIEGLLPREAAQLCITSSKVLLTGYMVNRQTSYLDTAGKCNGRGIQLLRYITSNPLVLEAQSVATQIFAERYLNKPELKMNLSKMFASAMSSHSRAQQSFSSWATNRAYATILHDIGVASEHRYRCYGTEDLLSTAETSFRNSIEATDGFSTHFAARACSLSHVLRAKSKYIGANTAIKEAKKWTIRASIAMIRQRPIYLNDKAIVASDLGHIALQLSSLEENHRSIYLERAIRHFHAAVNFATTDLRTHHDCLTYLAEAYVTRAKLTTSKDDLKQAMQQLRLAIEITKDANNFNSTASQTLALQIRQKAATDKLELPKNHKFITTTIRLMQTIYEKPIGTSEQRIEAALQAKLHHDTFKNREASAQAMSSAAEILIEAISEGNTRTEQLKIIRKFSFIPAIAAMQSLQAGHSPVQVVLSLEQRRSVIWNQLLGRKIDLETLFEKHSDLAQQLLGARNLLKTELQNPPQDADRFALLSLEINSNPEIQKLREKVLADKTEVFGSSFQGILSADKYFIADRYTEVIAKIRKIPGFETFMLRDLSTDSLKQLASQGPIVLIIHAGACSAIIIQSSGVIQIELPKFNMVECQKMTAKFKNGLNAIRNSSSYEWQANELHDLFKWLWEVAAEPVFDSLRFNGSKSHGGSLPRIWWVTSGYLNFFPIHAAGDHRRANQSGEPCTVMDRVISSYTPSLNALMYTRSCMDRMESSNLDAERSVLLAAMPVTPDKPDLGNTTSELDAVSAILKPQFQVSRLQNPRPRRRNVVTALRTCTIAHFACHGAANVRDPLKSKILLQDWKSNPLNVGFLMVMDIDNCQLAYISACESAVNADMRSMEEGLHMSGAFQMAGVPNTVATWWEILDVVSVRVAGDFYTGLKDQQNRGLLDVRNSAESLHNVMRMLREEGASPFVWAAYVHFGV